MRFRALPVTSLEDATLDFEQLQTFLTSGDIGSDSTGATARVTRINGTTVPLTGSAWIAPTLINSWVNFGGAFETAAYLKDPLGFVHLKGTIASGTIGTAAFVLPSGFRPGAMAYYLVPGHGTAPSEVQITSAGNVNVFDQNVDVGLSGINFLAEN